MEKQKEPLSLGEIAKGMEQRLQKISHIVSALLKHDEVEYIEIDRFEAMRRLGCKRRVFLYYVNAV